MQKKVVVIGAGQAACSFAGKLRQHDQECQITLIGEETFLPYQRPPLSKKYMTGEVGQEALLLKPEAWYSDNKIEHIRHNPAVSIDLDAKLVSLSDNSRISWDKLLIATGSSPRHLPDEIGGNLPGVYVLRDITHADEMRAELKAGRRVLVVGGGYIGLEAAAVCVSRQLDVVLVEAAERILQRVACPQTSDWFRNLHSQRGVKFHENAGLKKLQEKSGRVASAILADGSELEADFVLVGIGVAPNASLAAEAGLAVDNGIVVNAHCQTSNPDVYAAGDCTVFEFRGELSRLESVQNAIDQAECAADNMAGIKRDYAPVPWFWSDQYDTKLQIAGLNRGYDQIVVRPGMRENSIAHWYFANGEFIAVDAMNDPRTYMVGKKLLESGKSITPEQAADTALELKSLL